MTEIEAKVKYVKLARSLRTYGVSFFLVKVKCMCVCVVLGYLIKLYLLYWECLDFPDDDDDDDNCLNLIHNGLCCVLLHVVNVQPKIVSAL